MVLNPNADGIQLTDLIQGMNDTFYRIPPLILAYCRGEDEDPERKTTSTFNNRKQRA